MSSKGRERDLARAPAGTREVPSEHLLRPAPKRGHRRSRRRAQGERFFGYFLVATRKYLAYPGETGLIHCRGSDSLLDGVLRPIPRARPPGGRAGRPTYIYSAPAAANRYCQDFRPTRLTPQGDGSSLLKNYHILCFGVFPNNNSSQGRHSHP